MKVLHCSWIPETGEDFVQQGDFWLWAEAGGGGPLDRTELVAFLENTLEMEVSPYERRFHLATRSLLLPALDGSPLPAPEFEHATEDDPPAAVLQAFQVDALRLPRPIRQLGELRFLAFLHAPEARAGGDLLFWHYYTQSLQASILRDRYIPGLKFRRRMGGTEEGQGFEIYAGWEIVADEYEHLIDEAAERMPPAAATGGAGWYEPHSLLRHCAEVLVHRLVAQTSLSTGLERKLRGTLPGACRLHPETEQPWKSGADLDLYRQWRLWRQRLAGRRGESGFELSFRLHEASREHAPWRLELLIAPRDDPSQRLPLAEYWHLQSWARQSFAGQCGENFEVRLLLALGQAARMYSPLWQGLDEAHPSGIDLDLKDAFEFLGEHAWVLEDAGFTVMVPCWWTPEGRRRAKVRLKARTATPAASGEQGMDFPHLIAYRYELSLGEDVLGPEEWESLVESKVPLVQFRGRWLALDRERMREMLEFWRRHQHEEAGLALPELIRRSVEEDDFFEVEPESNLAELLDRLQEHSRLRVVEDEPPGFGTRLRPYQKRGLAWLAFLESLGVNGCLADDMGLGKTVQVLALLAQERASGGGEPPAPTLLVAPTSVIGNWRREIERFTPFLRTFVHHGAARFRDAAEFRAICLAHDVVVTSYALARKDEKLLAPVQWRRVVLDEAQNIKNPQSAQTRAVLKLSARHRLALTGTPVENRLLDLWSIFQFLNPGYLGRQSRFRHRYELPIQRDSDPRRAEMLRRLIGPFVLRRVKTDPEVLRDLPDKVENRQFCNLCREQAALYEAVVQETALRLGNAEGIGRQGLILSTLTRLKQICNHPAQFLHDGSEFSPARSPKLERLRDMLGDVIGEGESALVFTQFAEVGGRLEKFLRAELNCPVYYLHGAVPAAQRERMIAEFQDADTGPAVFVLSLKAGGVGITLTKANHVFHFDRWWNPAVEDQATDRAFRIGQSKNVFVHKFITLGTLEERIDKLIEDKKHMATLIVSEDESWLSGLDNETFRNLIALNRMAVVEA